MTTSIEWVRNPDGSKGETWPVVTGCTPVSEGCRNCYAARMAATRLKHHPRYRGLATNEGDFGVGNGSPKWTGEVRLNHDVLGRPFHYRKPRMIFVASMGDLFHPNVPPQFIKEVWHVMMDCPQCTFQILTKRAKRMMMFLNGWYTVDTEFQNLPKNIWLGVSVENQAAADKRIPWLLRTPAAVWFVSCEPLLGPIMLPSESSYIQPDGFGYNGPMTTEMGNWGIDPDATISWVICGGESGPGARPMHPDWARSLRDQCQAAGVPFFFKQWGAWTPDVIQILECKPGDKRFAKVRGPSGKEIWMARVGKKRAGHLLGGRAWQEFPGRKG